VALITPLEVVRRKGLRMQKFIERAHESQFNKLEIQWERE